MKIPKMLNLRFGPSIKQITQSQDRNLIHKYNAGSFLALI